MKRIHFLKAVWSDIILLEQDHNYALIDTGYEKDKEEIIKYLKERSITSLNFILITHFHRDHYGSLEALIDTIDVQTVYIKPYSNLDGKTATGQISDENYRQSEMDYYQKLCLGKTEILQDLVKEFNLETDNGRDMSRYSSLLIETIEDVIGKKQEVGVKGLFRKGPTALVKNDVEGLEEFELITFLIIK